MEEKRRSDDSLQTYLEEGNIAFFGVRGALPDLVSKKARGRVRAFVRRRKPFPSAIGAKIATFETLAEVREEKADVYFLDHEALKVLFVDFPATARYVLIPLSPRASWLLAIPGLVRRMMIGLVRMEGIVRLPEGGKSRRWLVVRHELQESLNTRLNLSAEVGVQGFLDHLRKEGVRYVVARFYEKLPSLSREGGDLDILVADEDDAKIRSFLQAHPGVIGVDVWTVSRTSVGGITYYPPPLARKILESAVEGPAGAKIPAPREAFLSLAYHVLYHKGAFAGVPSFLPSVEVNTQPDNDYAGALERLAKQAGANVDITMEPLDEYLAEAGWRPKLDTLAKIALRNRWVWQRFFSGEGARELGLGVIIIKRKALELGMVEDIERRIREHQGFRILRKKVFGEEEIPRIRDELRGGVWNEKGGALRDFLPALALVVVDTNLARSARLGITHQNPEEGIKKLKGELRGAFRIGEGNAIHSTDNTHEAREYIEHCFPGEIEEIKKEIERVYEDIRIPFLERAKTHLVLMPRRLIYRFTLWRRRLAARLIRALMR